MKKARARIGFFGAELFSENMGCVAMTYSLLPLVKSICACPDETDYYFFVRNRHGDLSEISRQFGIKRKRLHVISCMPVLGHDRYFRDIPFKHMVRRCNIIIDLTQGDSFTDLYGDRRFSCWTAEKSWILRQGIPLVLGPQTVGPFEKAEHYEQAVRVMEGCCLILPRDLASFEYTRKAVRSENVFLSCDLAFALTCKKHETGNVIGLNISALLWGDDIEDTEKNFQLKADYRRLTRALIRELLRRGEHVCLLGHVAQDEVPARQLKAEFPTLEAAAPFVDPIEAKTCIAGMRLLIGARMHATIAAVSSAVPAVPLAYSRKFTGLYETIGYPFVVDLTRLNTEEALSAILNALEHEPEMRRAAEQACLKARKLTDVTREKLALALTEAGIETTGSETRNDP